MFTIQEYLDSLISDKETLVNNLIAKGVQASTNETFTTLAPKVLDIPVPLLQIKNVTYNTNGTFTILPDEGYNGISQVNVTNNVSADLTSYYDDEIPTGTANGAGLLASILKIPTFMHPANNTSCSYLFAGCKNLQEIHLFDTSNTTSFQDMFSGCYRLASVPTYNTSRGERFSEMLTSCVDLVTAPPFDLSRGYFFQNMFTSCSNLQNVPLYNLASATNVQNMFRSCPLLTDTSLDNILQMCANINPSYSGTKTLDYLGLTDTTTYSTARIQALPHYNDFISAGWIIR